MSELKPHSHLPFWGTGCFYSERSTTPYDVIKTATPLTLFAADKMIHKKDEKNPIVICDYGTADGGVSLQLMRDLLEHCKRKHGDDQCIQIIYEDQPTNDFNSLFTRIYGANSFLQEYENVFVSVCGTNFYDQCFPLETVDLGFSSTAMHWLYKRPCCLKETLFHALSSNPEERRSFEVQAAKDWERILLKRATELKKGGQLVIVCGAIDGEKLSRRELVFQQMSNIWRAMRDEKNITQEEFTGATFNVYCRNVKELSSPFCNKQSPVYKAGLRLISIEIKRTPCLCNTAWIESGKSKDDQEAARSSARNFISSMRASCNSSFKSALSNGRSEEEKRELTDKFFQRFEDIVAEDPGKHAFDHIQAYMHIEKNLQSGFTSDPKPNN